MTRRRHYGDRAPWQTDDYIDAHYEPEDHEPRGQVGDDIKAAVRAAYEAAGIRLGGAR